MNIVNRLLVLAFAVLFIGLGIGTAYAAPSVVIDPASSSVAGAGESFSVDVLVDPAGETLAGGTVELSFNSDVLSITSHSKGTIFSESSDMGSVWDTPGSAKINLAGMGCTATTAGTWASITFEVAAGASDGVYDIEITSAVLKDQTTAVLSGTTMTKGAVTVGTPPAGPSVSIDPASSSVAGAGESFSVDVLVDPAGETLAGGTVELSFNSDVLSITSHSKGTIFSESSDMGSVWDTPGSAKINLAGMGCTATTAGTWASITFDVATDAADGVYDIEITSAVLKDQTTAVLAGTTTTDGNVTVGVAVTPTLTTFTVTPATVEQGGTVEIDIAFSTAVDWVINVNSSTATVETWSSTSTNPTVKDWVTSTSTATGAYTVEVFMNGALADSKTVTVTEAGAAALASITSWTLPATGACGTAIDATVTIENTGTETLWFVVSVAGASTTGESIVGLGTAELDAGATKAVPVKIPVPGDADAAGTYTLYPDVYTLDGYPDVGTLQATGSGDTIVIS